MLISLRVQVFGLRGTFGLKMISFTFIHLTDAFIQSDSHFFCRPSITSGPVFPRVAYGYVPGSWTAAGIRSRWAATDIT